MRSLRAGTVGPEGPSDAQRAAGGVAAQVAEYLARGEEDDE
jgi:hypothetical protein